MRNWYRADPFSFSFQIHQAPPVVALLHMLEVSVASSYLLTKQGEFGPQSHPLEPWWLKLHGAFAFAFTWFFGLLWGTHVTVAWPRGRR